MNFIDEKIERYAEMHSQSEPEILKRLTHETWQKMVMPRMLSGHLQGRFLSLLGHLVSARRILEIGTYTGYSALCLAECLPVDGELITIDLNDELATIHAKYIATSRHAAQIHPLYGDARLIIPKLEGNFDLVFVDADKENYPLYFELVLDRINPGGLLILDNVLWNGKVPDETVTGDPETDALRTMNDLLIADHRVQVVMLPIRDGLTIARKL